MINTANEFYKKYPYLHGKKYIGDGFKYFKAKQNLANIAIVFGMVESKTDKAFCDIAEAFDSWITKENIEDILQEFREEKNKTGGNFLLIAQSFIKCTFIFPNDTKVSIGCEKNMWRYIGCTPEYDAEECGREEWVRNRVRIQNIADYFMKMQKESFNDFYKAADATITLGDAVVNTIVNSEHHLLERRLYFCLYENMLVVIYNNIWLFKENPPIELLKQLEYFTFKKTYETNKIPKN